MNLAGSGRHLSSNHHTRLLILNLELQTTVFTRSAPIRCPASRPAGGIRTAWVAVCLGAAASLSGNPHPGAADPLIEERPDLIDAWLQSPFEPAGGYLFAGEQFPVIRWSQPLLVERLWGQPAPDPEVRWFDSDGREIQQPGPPGRYLAVVEAGLDERRQMRRGLTLFRFSPAASASGSGSTGDRFPMELAQEPAFGLRPELWQSQAGLLIDFTERAAFDRLLRHPEGAILVGALAEAQQFLEGATVAEERQPGEIDPAAIDRDHHRNLRRRLDRPSGRDKDFGPVAGERAGGVEPLGRPKPEPDPAPILTEHVLVGGEPGAGADAGLAGALDALFREWLEHAEQPFTAAIAIDGRLVFHRAYGERPGEPVDHDTVYPLFSISKSVSGILTGMFLDAGRLHLDRPLAEVLPALARADDGQGNEGPPLTVRRCLMHVSGLHGHSAWGGLGNPWLDEVVADAFAIGRSRPGYGYSGTAYDLVGLAMEQVTGTALPTLFEQHLFEPLGMRGARVGDPGAGIHLRAIDLARLGQLILNGGAYGDHRLFTPATRDELLPRSYTELFPELELSARADYGLGLRWADEAHPGVADDPPSAIARVPSDRTLGHGALSGSVFRVDLTNQMVIAIGRFEAGPDHGMFVRRLLALLADQVH